MTPPEKAEAGGHAGAEALPAVSVCAEPGSVAAAPEPVGGLCPGPAYQILRNRPEFLAAARARRHGTPGFLLQARLRSEAEGGTGIRVGFTCSKKVGNAVARNRAKRRLREIARLVIGAEGRPGWDYVLVGRQGDTAGREFTALLADLRTALARVHR